MKEVIEELAELIRNYKNLDGSINSQPDKEDTKNMLVILKDLIHIKTKELSIYNMLFCHAAHSFTNEEIILFDSLRNICQDDLSSIEDLRSTIKSITY